MHKQFKVPVKLLLIATIAVLSLLMVSGLALADQGQTSNGEDRFEIVEFSGLQPTFLSWMTGIATTMMNTARSKGYKTNGL